MWLKYIDFLLNSRLCIFQEIAGKEVMEILFRGLFLLADFYNHKFHINMSKNDNQNDFFETNLKPNNYKACNGT